MSEISTYGGPYARLRDIIGAERSSHCGTDPYSMGYASALDVIEEIIGELEREQEADAWQS